MSVPTITVG